MFDEVPNQFHRLIASSNTSLPLSSFPLHGTTPTTAFPSFDPYPSHQSFQSHLLHPLHHPSPTNKDEEKEDNSFISTDLELEREGSISEPVDPWSADEVHALLRIRSSMENWFADFTWECVSRKLAEHGFKRSAEKCKEKFEEESRFFDGINKHCRFFSELDQLCHGDNTDQVVAEKDDLKILEKTNNDQEEDKMGKSLEDYSRNETLVLANPTVENREVVRKSKSKKRKRHHKREMLKQFCEDIVHKMMAQQEKLYNKLLEDMMKRDEENIAREEVWRKQEMERINKEIEIKAHEQAIASDRQAAIIDFLKKFTSGSLKQCFAGRNEELLKVLNRSNIVPPSQSLILAQNTNPTCQLDTQNKMEVPTSSSLVLVQQNPRSCSSPNNPNVPISVTETLSPQNPNSTPDPNIRPKEPTSSTLSSFNTQNSPLAPTPLSINKAPQNPNLASDDSKDHAKRWPGDEVLALINLRCNLNNSGGGEDKEGAKGPLWERISQGMLDLGYKRSSKRCKEKWENINKYFRKTKDANKRRSLDSRTCPYFHQLSNLYKQGTLVATSDHQGLPENRPSLPENHSSLPETGPRFSEEAAVLSGDANMNIMHAAEGEKNMLQLVPAFDFEF